MGSDDEGRDVLISLDGMRSHLPLLALTTTLIACSSDPSPLTDAGFVVGDASEGGLVAVTTLGPVRGAVEEGIPHFFGLPLQRRPRREPLHGALVIHPARRTAVGARRDRDPPGAPLRPLPTPW